ncbi:MAG: DUF952 domain-containing protein [Labilithrix sp.]|nr:DUF952 domain-containing protein [Labilithrix sp.]MCW5836878.1 DUF952 domain-containing protein [Labilithrix sp.]
MRWLFHVLRSEDAVFVHDAASAGSERRYRPGSLEREGFLHASYRDAVLESARLYFPAGAALSVFAIDPRRLDVPVDVVDTPRGPMPHVRGSIPERAVRVLQLDDVPAHADLVDDDGRP